MEPDGGRTRLRGRGRPPSRRAGSSSLEGQLIEERILRYYEEGDEDGRLASGAERLELLRVQDILRRVLPGAPLRVLDVGGGPGAHARWLAADGHTVHVVDPVPRHVRRAAGHAGVTAALGEARALDEPDASYDAVLLFGPLYHLVERADRLAAWREAVRVVRPGGVVAATAINRFASLHDGLRRGFLERPGVREVIEATLADGRHLPGDRAPFTTAYLHHPDDLAEEVRACGLHLEHVYPVEGAMWLIEGIESWIDDPGKRELLLWGLRSTEREPALLGASRHLLAVARAAGEGATPP
ncbi:class I SAM-dependent methyltransferase [Actinomadura litoris]|uniref:class I SAM-dependent methyltransferase n=1 Tax=Actinomadura litoris TaxID=2678616 RepID=UPI001FA6BF11|nr:class I SAM-dependent methyltransferase [Actinomadura litoris]